MRRIRTIPRLTLVFIITLLISGGILTYFSINNISNFKELTQKKISEEEQEIVDQISSVFQEKLEDIAKVFDDPAAAWLSDTVNSITATFVTDNNGSFLWPWYIDAPPLNSRKASPPGFEKSYAEAEIAEFRELNMKRAQRYFQSSLQQSSSGIDSVQSLNALARVSVKLKQYDKAQANYSKIINDHYSTPNTSGFPYSYFAILQLFELQKIIKDIDIAEDVFFFISKMNDGLVPLNPSSTELVNQLEAWIRNSSLSDNEQRVALVEYIQLTKDRLAFISDYSGLIKDFLSSGSKPDLLKINNSFYAYRGIRSDYSDLILLNLEHDSVYGYVLEIDSVWLNVTKGFSFPETEFEYEIALIKSNQSDFLYDKDLTTIVEFSSFFPSHLVKIELKDKNIVTKYITRRSWIYGIALILLLGGMLLGISLILRDIRREKRMALLRADFMSNVTHELKTPLTSISMFAESIFHGQAKTESDQKKFSNVIIKESGNLRRMINNILTFSAKEDDKLNYQFKQTDISKLVKSTLEEMSYWLDLHNFYLVTDIQENVMALTDSEAFKQALANLINNAIKYSPATKSLDVRLYKQNTKIFLEVKDAGLGIPQDEIPKIFEKFYRVRSKDTEPTSGTGIGLTVTKDIIEAHGGSIQVNSELNKGSMFKITLNT